MHIATHNRHKKLMVLVECRRVAKGTGNQVIERAFLSGTGAYGLIFGFDLTTEFIRRRMAIL